MNTRLQVLFVVALLAVLLAVGVVAARVGGWPLAAAWAGLVVVGVVVGAARARAAAAAAASSVASSAGRTCTCCTTTVHDPVRVVP